jgi:uncharacterized membrane protein YqiK
MRTLVSAPLPQDYLHSLGKARTAQVQKDARIGEAEAKRDAGIRVREIGIAQSPQACWISDEKGDEGTEGTQLIELGWQGE